MQAFSRLTTLPRLNKSHYCLNLARSFPIIPHLPKPMLLIEAPPQQSPKNLSEKQISTHPSHSPAPIASPAKEVSAAENTSENPPSLMQQVGLKIRAFVLPIFEKISAFFSNISTFLTDIFWPYEEASPNTETPSFMHSIIQNSLEYSKEQKIAEPKVVVNLTAITTPITAVFLGINYGLVPFYIHQNPTENFLETALTAECIQNVLLSKVGVGLNVTFLKDYELLPTGDPLDKALYQGLIVTAASSVDFVTSGNITTPLHIATAVLANLPFVQKRVLNLPIISDINDKVHTFVKTTREKTKLALANRIKPFLVGVTQKKLSSAAPSTLPNNQKKSKGLFSKATRNAEKFFGPTLTKLASNLVQGACEDIAANATNACFDSAANLAADGMIDIVINFGKETFRLASFNQMLVKTASNLPILGSISLIIGGGTTQTLRELILRVTGATVFLTTGSSFLPLLIINGPNAINFFMRLRQRKLKKAGWADRNAIDCLSTISDWITNKTATIPSDESQVNSDKSLVRASINAFKGIPANFGSKYVQMRRELNRRKQWRSGTFKNPKVLSVPVRTHVDCTVNE